MPLPSTDMVRRRGGALGAASKLTAPTTWP